MSDEGLSLDPEVEELLREVAVDPDSMLLRVDRPKKWRGLFSRSEAARSSEPLTTRAEKELLDLHREQVADLLYQTASWTYLNGPNTRTQRRPSGASQLRSDAQNLERVQNADGVARARLLAAQALSLSEVGGGPTALQLAQASYRLLPSQRATVLSALSLLQAGQYQSSQSVVQTIARPESSVMRGHIEDCLALGSFRAGKHVAARQHYRQSFEAVGQPVSALSWYFNALLTENAQECGLAQIHAEQAAAADPGAVRFFVDLTSSTVELGEWMSGERTARFARDLSSKCPEPLAPILSLVMKRLP